MNLSLKNDHVDFKTFSFLNMWNLSLFLFIYNLQLVNYD